MPAAERDRSHLWISLRRWRDIILAAVLGAILIFLCLDWQLERLLRVSPYLFWGATIGAVVGLVLWIGKRWSKTPERLRYFSTCPPSWAAGALGAGSLLFALGSSAELRRELSLPDDTKVILDALGLGCGVIVPVVFLFSLISLRRERVRALRKKPAESAREQQRIEDWSFDQIVRWLKDDSPIEDPTNDRFGRQEMAERIAKRLRGPSPQAQAIVGALGSGKSSLRNLVANCITRQNAYPQIRMADVELWPFATSTAAVDAIIHRLIDELAGFVDVTALRGLPSAYTEAMKSAGGLWAAATHLLLGAPRTHQEILSRIDEVATAIGVRLVLWVEDLERFCNSGISRDGDTVESAEDTARLGPIRALLNGLESPSVKSITVVTATTTLRNRFDLEKIARFVETLPGLEDRAVARLLGQFRKGCRTSKDYFEPALPRARHELDLLEQAEGQIHRYAVAGSRVHTISDAVLVLCRTPRTLKQGLRQCLDVWEELTGEIDFDDLMVMSLLRVASPDAFALAGDSLVFQRISDEIHFSQKWKKEDREAWNGRLEHLALRPELRDAVKKIIECVFDAKQKLEKPQGFAMSGHADYWQRFLSQSIPMNEFRDQAVLRVIDDCKDGDSALLDLIENPSASNAVVDFSHRLAADRVLRLLVTLVTRRADEDAQSWPGEEPPGLNALWHIWRIQRRHRYDMFTSQLAFDEIKQAIQMAVPRNLALALFLERYFVVSGGQSERLIYNDGICDQPFEAMRLLRELVTEHYLNQPERLASQLRSAPLISLFRICLSSDDSDVRTPRRPPLDEQHEFADTILKATLMQPNAMLAQLFHLVTREIIVIDPGPEPERRVGFDSATAIAVFGSVAAVQDVVREADVQSEELIRLKSILLSPPVQSPATSQEVSESTGNNDSNQMS